MVLRRKRVGFWFNMRSKSHKFWSIMLEMGLKQMIVVAELLVNKLTKL